MQSLATRDKAVIWHPFTPFKYASDPIAIVKGEGIYLIDENGNRYIDAISSWWVNLHGHAHPYIAEKIYQQALTLEQVIFAGFTHEPAIQLAERLLPILPGNYSKIFYSDNGSTATEVALKMALQFWWNHSNAANEPHTTPARNKILAFNNSYHGDTFGAMSVSDRSVFTLAFQDKLFEVIFIDTPTADNIESLKSIIKDKADSIAAFIYEPLVQGAGGIKMYDSNLLNELLQLIQSNNIICIADEVMTGFGRTGKLFAGALMDVSADIICLSKGLTGGTMALGVTAVNNKIVAAFKSEDQLKTFFHGHSFTANPLACTAALASLDLLEREEAIKGINNISEWNMAFLEELQATDAYKNNKIKNLRVLGTILAFEMNSGKDNYLNNISKTVTALMLEQGIYLRPLGNTVYLMPPYCIQQQEMGKIYAAILHLLHTL